MPSWGGQKGTVLPVASPPPWQHSMDHPDIQRWSVQAGFSSSFQDKAHTRHRLPMLCFGGFSPLHYSLTAGALELCDDLGEGPTAPWQGGVSAASFPSFFSFYPGERINVACQGTACSLGYALVWTSSSSKRLSITSEPFPC